MVVRSHGGTVTHSTKGAVSSQHVMVTRGATTMAARNAVFNTQELLEAIMLQLPTKDLITVEGVCSHWRATARTSLKLRREKFLSLVKVSPLPPSQPTCNTSDSKHPEAHTPPP